jgi:hypothetical protein
VCSGPLYLRVEGLLYTWKWLDNYELVTVTFTRRLHGQWGPMLRRSIHIGRLGASGVFLMLRWMTLEKVLGVDVMRH